MLKEKYSKLYNDGKITKVQRHRMISDEINKIFAKRYGFDYGQEFFGKKIKKDKEVKFDDIPDDFDISMLPDDVEIIFKEHFPELEDSFLGDEE